jgi:hypothetical protein
MAEEDAMRRYLRIGALSRLSVPVVAAVLATATIAISAPGSPQAATPPAAPVGLTAIALDGKVGLAWQPSTGATSYSVYRGTSKASINQLVSPAGYAATNFTDNSAANGTTYYYAVKAVSDGGTSVTEQITQATPVARSCSTGNAVVVENCYPGTTAWKTPDGTRSYDGGIDGFVSASSINAGGSVEARAQLDWDAPWHIEIYRTGWYGGTQGRLIGVIPGLVGQWPPDCDINDQTGLGDCSGWQRTATISTTTDWVSGVYMIKMVRDDNGNHTDTLLVVRKDGSHSDVLHGIPTSTYQAYNRYNGKSLYTGLSNAPATISGTNRAVKVSYDRPYSEPNQDADAHDWYPRTDVAIVSWLERQGYDSTYIASEDLHTDGGQLLNHKVFVGGAHDEYWSQQMRDALTAARNAGVSLFFPSANSGYWRIRFEPSPVTGRANRVQVGYKTIESGPADPVSATTTFRDPTINKPENALLGQMYVGENLTKDFPLFVSAAQGQSRLWRYTSLNSLASGTTASIGSGLVGWEWDARVDNGQQPSGVNVLASTPVNGQIIQANGAFQSPGSATQETTIYKAPSGATVFDAGTINWWRGLGYNVHGAGEPDSRIQQATMNILSDMGVEPSTPASSMTVDAQGPPSVSSTVPANGATSVQPNVPVKVTFNKELDPATVSASDFTFTAADGTNLPVASATLDSTGRIVTVTGDDAFDPFTQYTLRVGTDVKTWEGVAATSPYTTSFSTGQGTPPVVLQQTPAAGSGLAPTDVVVSARFDRRLNPATVNGTTFSLQPTGGGTPVAASVSYDANTRTAKLTPNARLAEFTQYSALVTSGVQATDGVAMADPSAWTFTTGTNLTTASLTPAPLSSGISPAANVRAVFARAVDPATVTASSFTVTGPGGPVAGTVSYDPATRTATFTPSAPLSLTTTYTANLTAAVHASDGGPLNAVSWTFTTALTAPAAPATTTLAPAASAVGVSNGASVYATFNQPLDAATVNAQTFMLTPDAGAPVAATVSYDAATQRAVLRPAAALTVGTHYTAALATGIRSSLGAPMAAAVTWGFTTANCPCALNSAGTTPQEKGLPVQDFRPGAGPFSYELGTKITVTTNVELTALRFYKDPGETGTHVGRVWNASGTQLASTTFQDESASGWQRQTLATPLTLTAGQTYIVSVGLNAFYSKTQGGLATQLVSGPLRSVTDGANGVYANTAGQFPANAYAASNYFVDGVVRLPSEPRSAPAIQTVSPLSGATGASTTPTITATFARALDSGTVNAHTFQLVDQDGTAIPADVSYDDGAQAAVLKPKSALDTGTAYTAILTTGIKSDDETPMAAAYQWTFTTIPPAPPVVTQTSPATGVNNISPGTSVTATFSQSMTASTITGTSFTLTGPGGQAISATVAYDGATRTATLDPIAPLASSTTYTAKVTTGVKSTRNVAMAADYTWTFTTSACPCSLFNNAAPVNRDGNLDVANGRSGAPPYSLELGVKVQVVDAAQLTAIRFYKDANETGTHVGRVWTVDGTQLGSVTFSGETAGAGWQEQALATPIDLTPGQTYVVSVNANSRFGMTAGTFWSVFSSGPLRSVADGQNGVYGDAGGAFPTKYWGASNYYVDAVVK